MGLCVPPARFLLRPPAAARPSIQTSNQWDRYVSNRIYILLFSLFCLLYFVYLCMHFPRSCIHKRCFCTPLHAITPIMHTNTGTHLPPPFQYAIAAPVSGCLSTLPLLSSSLLYFALCASDAENAVSSAGTPFWAEHSAATPASSAALHTYDPQRIPRIMPPYALQTTANVPSVS